VFVVSAASHLGLKELVFAMAEVVTQARSQRVVAVAERIVLRPVSSRSEDDFTVTQTGEGWRVRGVKPERWIRQTDFSNEEAVGFLADRLNRLGVEKRLAELGAVEGDPVLIGDPDNAVVFDFKPGLDAGGAEMLGRRGEDERLREERPSATRRREIDAGFVEREEHEARADVARRVDHDELQEHETAEDGVEVVFVSDPFDEAYTGEDGDGS
ncbi:MAG: Obg family GTPase CgtA, partial [Marmoricola sp.]